MTQDEINESEWSNPRNWRTGLYISKRDVRFFVPKRRGIGETVNFGHKHSIVLFVIFLAVVSLPGLVVTLPLLLSKK